MFRLHFTDLLNFQEQLKKFQFEGQELQVWTHICLTVIHMNG